VIIASRSLPAGTRLTRSDLRVARLSGDKTLIANLLPAQAEPSLLGRTLAAPVLAGLPLGRPSIAAAGGGPAAFTLAVPALHALGGGLNAGDRVTVLVTFTSPSGAATARVVARNLVVLAVGPVPAGVDSSTATIPVTVALPNPSVASQLALANSVGKIDLLRDGASTTAAIPAASASTGAAP
jgi:Flp pilus assembly protein CpaB